MWKPRSLSCGSIWEVLETFGGGGPAARNRISPPLAGGQCLEVSYSWLLLVLFSDFCPPWGGQLPSAHFPAAIMVGLTMGPETQNHGLNSLKPWAGITFSLNCSLRYSVTATREVTNTENWYQRSGVVSLTIPDHVVLKPFRLVCRKNLESLEKQLREVLDCWK